MKETHLGVHNKYRNTNYHLREIKIPPQTYFHFYSEWVIQKNDTPLQMEARFIELPYCKKSASVYIKALKVGTEPFL